MIVEMAGRPAKHLSESLEKHVGILHKVSDVEVHSIKVSEPKKFESEGGKKMEEDMFTAFAECDFECETLSRLTQIMFDFMPSSIEVVSPSKVNISSTDATDLMNNISGRLHRYDEFAKVANIRMKKMAEQIEMAKKIISAKDAEIDKMQGKKKGSSKKKVDKKTQLDKDIKKKSTVKKK